MKNDFEKIKNNLKKTKFNCLEVIVVLILSICLGATIGSLIKNDSTQIKKVKYDNEIDKVYDSLLNEYYGKLSEKELQNAAIEGMIGLLEEDEYSSYLNGSEQETLNQYLDGSYKGIGIQMTNVENDIVVTAVFENSPAEEQGIKIGDIIIKVNDVDVTEKELQDVVDMIKNNPEEITITIKRENETKTIKINTNAITIPSVDKKIYEENGKKIGYLRISIFAANTDEQFEKRLKKLEKEEIDSLIIDLRDNSGGHLKTVSTMIDLFLGQKDVMYQLKKNNKTTKVYGTGKRTRDYEIVVLTNENSASASEILASALQEEYGATLVGKKTFGKGTVQQAINLSTGSMIKYTTEEWLTSKGNQINKKGIKPDVEVELDSKYFETYEEKDDNQLQKAINILKDK